MGLRNARLGFRRVEESHITENVVYNELRACGYSVDVGVITMSVFGFLLDENSLAGIWVGVRHVGERL